MRKEIEKCENCKSNDLKHFCGEALGYIYRDFHWCMNCGTLHGWSEDRKKHTDWNYIFTPNLIK